MATVLIVDDDPKLLTMLRRTLAYEGFRVLSATNGTEALGEVQAHRPDVVVLDWLMPGLDGIGVLERLRAAGDKTLRQGEFLDGKVVCDDEGLLST